MKRLETPWLKSAKFDLSLIIGPSLISVFVVILFRESFDQTSNVPFWAWLLLVLAIDVAHVYSTLFRTYLHSHEAKENRTLLTLIPIGVWLVGVGLYSISAITFWSALAYVAVFHFMRQQYGFMRLYSRNDRSDKLAQWSSTLVIYLATLYPVIYWHSHQPRNFHWFIDGDFATGLPAWVSQVTGVIYIAAALFYFVNEFKNAFSNRQAFNVPKNVLIVGTMASWYFGIVHFNGDMAFTVTNIVSHGIPYMALVWLYGERQTLREDSPRVFGKLNYSVFFSKLTFPLFIGVLLILAYIEEGLWAGFVWRDHLSAFGPLAALPPITAPDTLTWLIPLLTLPQATHYVLDGFIWRMKDSDANWQKVLFRKGSNV